VLIVANGRGGPADGHAACTRGGVNLRQHVWIVEDEPAAAALAVELCEGQGADATVFQAPLPYLSALRDRTPPGAVVLDWRLEHELSAALFMATRHRYPELPVIYWTGHASSALPSMIMEDARTMVIDKAGGAEAFERALAWAGHQPSPQTSGA
jgi:DNA-binding NtrC family response regulator